MAANLDRSGSCFGARHGGRAAMCGLHLSRPFDGLNWLSLLFPPGVFAGLLVA